MEITNKARIIQNTTHISNDKIREIIEFVNPLAEYESIDEEVVLTEAQKSLEDLFVRIIYESNREKQLLDFGINGSYIPQIKWENFHGLTIIEKPIMTIVVPNRRNTKFPLYSNYPILRGFENQGIEVTKDIRRQLRQARLEIGHSVIVYLSLEELLVHYIAHELRHHLQHLIDIQRDIDLQYKLLENIDLTIEEKITIESMEIVREKDANKYATRQVRLWRSLHNPKDAYPILDLWLL